MTSWWYRCLIPLLIPLEVMRPARDGVGATYRRRAMLFDEDEDSDEDDLMQDTPSDDDDQAPKGHRGDFPRNPRHGILKSTTRNERWVYQSDRSVWWDLLRHDEAYTAGSHASLEFRGKFRVPRKLFDTLVRKTRKSGRFASKSTRLGRGRRCHPLELKVLASLRMLAKGCDSDTVSEAAQISPKTLAAFHHKWMKWGAETLFPRWVQPPTGAKLKHWMEMYAKLGTPGCVASTDGVHIPWGGCPVAWKSTHQGKEGKPTLAFNMSCGPTGEIAYCTDAFPGARNDKTMAHWDPFLQGLKHGSLYGNVKYALYTRDGGTRWMPGPYTMTDNGYHNWRCMLFPYACSTRRELRFTERLESIRKKSECQFGILKKRFRCLAVPCMYRSSKKIDHQVKFCVMLHNMLLHHDGYDTVGQSDSDYSSFDSSFDMSRVMAEEGASAHQGLTTLGQPDRTAKNDDKRDREESHFELRAAVMDHFDFVHAHGGIKWVKTCAKLRPRAKNVYEEGSSGEDTDEQSDNDEQ